MVKELKNHINNVNKPKLELLIPKNLFSSNLISFFTILGICTTILIGINLYFFYKQESIANIKAFFSSIDFLKSQENQNLTSKENLNENTKKFNLKNSKETIKNSNCLFADKIVKSCLIKIELIEKTDFTPEEIVHHIDKNPQIIKIEGDNITLDHEENDKFILKGSSKIYLKVNNTRTRIAGDARITILKPNPDVSNNLSITGENFSYIR